MIKLEKLSKSLHKNNILNDINLHILNGEIVALIGESGHGKTTLLRCIQGLEKPDQGKVILNGECGYVFQDYHLFHNMTVLENIVYAPLKVKKINKNVLMPHIKSWLKRLKLHDKSHAYPHQLSGGQKQRVAIIRALALEPKILLLDEPTSALDADMAKIVMELLKEQATTNGLTVLMVTHQLELVRPYIHRQIYIRHGQVENMSIL